MSAPHEPIRPGVRRLFRLALRRPELRERDVEEEIRLHLQLRAEQLVRSGMTPEAARAEAERRFGAAPDAHGALRHTALRAERSMQLRDALSAVGYDLRYAARSLRRQPLFTAAVVIALGLGIGANATMFGVVDRLLLRAPAHVIDAERVARLHFSRTMDGVEHTSPSASYPQYVLFRDESRSYARVAAMYTWRAPLRIGEDSRQAQVSRVSASFFPLLGVRPALGRFFTEEEDREPVGVPVAVLSHGLWEREYGRDPEVLGRTIHFSNEPYTVIGVAPPGFTGLQLEAVDAWAPISTIGPQLGGDEWATSHGMTWLQIVGRLRAGVTRDAAAAEAQLLFRRELIAGQVPEDFMEELRPVAHVSPVQINRGPNPSAVTRVSTWLIGVSGVVLLIACANVANLLLARAMRRRQEVAVRLALGVSRRRLLAQLLTEGVLLAGLGAMAGVLIAHWGGRLLQLALIPDVAWSGVLADARVLAFASALALLAAVLASLLPALQGSRPELMNALKSGARGEGRRRSRTRTALMLSQAVLSVVLLVGAGLFVKSLVLARTTDMGMDAADLLLVEVSGRNLGLEEGGVPALNQAMLERAEALPMVRRAALATSLPLYSARWTTVRVPGVDSLPVLPAGGPFYNVVTHRYFETMGVPIVAGRGFTGDERPGSPPVVVISQTLARHAWPNASAIGQCIRLGASDTLPCREVVGVAADVSQRELRAEPVHQVYAPMEQLRNPPGYFLPLLVRTAGDAALLIPSLRRELAGVAPAGAHVGVRPFEELVAPHVRPWQLGAVMFGIFGAIALVIAVIGLYSVIAYDVAQRTHELGVRVALGAGRRNVLGLVFRSGMGVALVGVVLGMLVALAASRRVQELLFDVSATDPAVYGAVAAVLLLAAAAATLGPAWRAARVPPSTALRGE